ncbi:MAG: DNA-formamidopyrimidine glycosylase family protein [Acidimicrobiales bacterium]|nr:DNA-formamidopyrimidine glycosylase family protein [Acidimicrobiales bacterium]
MPEMIEVEQYRRTADAIVGRKIAAVHAPDDWYLKRGTTAAALEAALLGTAVAATRRIGKLLLLDTPRAVLGLHFGMTGRLVVDGIASIDRLEYSSHRYDEAWVRFALGFARGGRLEIVDPRRLGGVELDPVEDRLGIDALSVKPAQLRDALAASRAPLKAWLLTQDRIAGIGNLLADEMLWRAGIDPLRPACSLEAAEVRRLHHHLQATIGTLSERGGSHTGDLHEARVRGASCPRDGAPLLRRTIGGRTTYSCPRHQR